MRGGLVPFVVAHAYTDKASVAHIYRNKQTLTAFRRHRALSEYHRIRVDIVVYCGEAVSFRQAHAAQDNLGHSLAVEYGKPLNNLHIVDIIIEQFPADIGEVFGDGVCLCLFEPFYGVGDFALASLGFQRGDCVRNLLF